MSLFDLENSTPDPPDVLSRSDVKPSTVTVGTAAPLGIHLMSDLDATSSLSSFEPGNAHDAAVSVPEVTRRFSALSFELSGEPNTNTGTQIPSRSSDSVSVNPKPAVPLPSSSLGLSFEPVGLDANASVWKPTGLPRARAVCFSRLQQHRLCLFFVFTIVHSARVLITCVDNVC